MRHGDLERLRGVWTALGRDDPLWAVLSHPRQRGGRWDTDAFFATGKLEIDAHMVALDAQGLARRRALALDFGCGAGRLTRALAGHFEHVVGVDLSPSMIDTACRLNTDVANVQFLENHSPRLEQVADASVDLVYSNMTLQHIPAALAEGYVAQFLRVVAPGGVVIFQFVSGTDASWRGRVFARVSNRMLNPLRRLLWRRRQVFEMHVLSEARVQAVLDAHPDCRLLHAMDDASAGAGWHGRRWWIVRDARGD